MFSGVAAHQGFTDAGVPPLPGISTVLSHRDDIASLMQWPPSPTVFDHADITNYSDFHVSNGNNLLDTLPEFWENPMKGDDYLSLGSSLPANEGREKVEKAATCLNISIDPVRWTKGDVLKWLRYSMRCNHSSPGMIVEADWMVDGKGLCDMTLEDFNLRLPKDGDVLHSELDLWKTVQLTNACDPVLGPIAGLFAGDYRKDSIFSSAPNYANLEPAEVFHNPHFMDLKYLTAPPNLLQADPNLQQVIGNCGQVAFDNKVNSYHDYNNNDNNNNNNNIGDTINCKQLLYNIVKSERSEEIQSNNDDNSWLMSNSMTSSPTTYQEHKPKVNQRKWIRLGSDGVSTGVMPDVVAGTVTHRRGKKTITLWQFLKELLITSVSDPAPIRWLDRDKGIFKIEDSVRVARLWGERKKRPAMNYDKLSRSIRQYYKKGIIKKTSNSKRLVYQFCSEFL